MSRSRPPRRRLGVEVLEDRLTPTTGVPWLDPGNLTLSFVPDGTDANGKPSSLTSLLGAEQSAVWKREVLRAYQTWAAQTNVNVGVVPDGGQPMGMPGHAQGDARFGDFRIGARPLSSDQNDSLAGSVGYEPGGGTWAGDFLFNTKFQFAVQNPTGDQHDLYSVALHEAGNTLGVKDNWIDPGSVMHGRYKVTTGLTPTDVAAVRALYGARVDDAYEGSSGNGTLATAYDLNQTGPLTRFSADVTRTGDVDVYRFTTPDAASGVTSLTVELEATGMSLFTGRVTVYDGAGNPVGAAAATDPLANNLSVPIVGYQPSATYSVQVEGAGSDVFSVGAYVLRLNYGVPHGTSDVRLGRPAINSESQANETFDTAAPLAQLNSVATPTFAVAGHLNAGDVDWYRITPQWSGTGTGTLTVSVWPAEQNGVRPVLRVYDAAGALLGADVIANENGTYTVQLPAQQAGQTYHIQVQAAAPGGSHGTGDYVVGATFTPTAAVQFNALNGTTVTAAQSVTYSQMTVDQARLTQFSLSANTGGSSVEAAVRMSIFDAQGRRVFTMVAHAGQGRTTGSVWLAAGTYTVVFNAATRTGAPLPDLTFDLKKRERSSPIEPFVHNPTSDPTGTIGTPPAVKTSPTVGTIPVWAVIHDAIDDPYLII